MKQFDLTEVTASVGLVVEEKTINHLIEAYTETFTRLARPMLQSSAWYTNTVVVLEGCVLTGSNPGLRNCSAGTVFISGYIYEVPAHSFTTGSGQIGVWEVYDSNTTTESTLTSGGNAHVLQNLKARLTPLTPTSSYLDETATKYNQNWQSYTITNAKINTGAGGAITYNNSTVRYKSLGQKTVALQFNVDLTYTTPHSYFTIDLSDILTLGFGNIVTGVDDNSANNINVQTSGTANFAVSRVDASNFTAIHLFCTAIFEASLV